MCIRDRIDAGQGVEFTLQPVAGPRVLGNVRAEHLDRDRPAGRVQREVDHAHPALTDALDQPIWAQALGEPLGRGGGNPAPRHTSA